MRKWRVVTLLALVIGQVAAGGLATIATLMKAPTIAAASSHSILVGPGFTDVSPHEIIRTSGDTLYTVAPTCDSAPSCANNTLRVFKGNQPGTPSGFTEQDSAHSPTGNIGTAAIAIDGADTIHVAWNGRDGSGSLNYRTFSTITDTWSATALVGTTNWTTFLQGDEGVALALDSNGMPHAVWSAIGGDGRLHVFYGNKGGSWSPQQVDDVPLTGNRRALHPTIGFTADNTLVVAWLEGTFNYVPDGIIRVRRRASGGTWAATETINDPAGAMTTVDNGPSLLITPDGTIHLTFVAANPPDQVRYWYNSGGGWQGDRQPPAQVTHDPSLGPDGSGGMYIYGHGTPAPSFDGHGVNLYSFHKAAGATIWEAWTLYASGSFDCSVSTRWAQFFQAHAEEVDIAYWADQPLPTTLYVGTDIAAVPPQPVPLPPTRPSQSGGLGTPAVLPQARRGGATVTAVPKPLPPPR